VRYPHRPVAGGGEQAPDTLPHGSGLVSIRNTAVATEEEMMNNRPTPDTVHAPEKLQEEFPKQRVEIGHGEVVIAAPILERRGRALAAKNLAVQRLDRREGVEPRRERIGRSRRRLRRRGRAQEDQRRDDHRAGVLHEGADVNTRGGVVPWRHG